jgi:hypothetical protein
MIKIKIILSALAVVISAMPTFAIEQTICFSQKDSGVEYSVGKPVYVAVLGDDAVLNGGKCNGVKLADMNKKGWRLVQVVSGLNNSFGMVFEKGGK